MPALSLADVEAVAAGHVTSVARQLVGPSLGRFPGDRATHPHVHTVDDARAGAALHELFAASFPDHGLVIEDRPLHGEGRPCVWYIDPIDGSANHLRGIPYVSVSAGLQIDGVPAVGVVHDVVRDVTLSAHTGGGTTRHENGERSAVRVASTSRLADAISVLHLARRGPLVGRPGALAHLLWNVHKIRCMGSIALDLALLAAGEVDLLVAGRGRPQRKLDILGGFVLVAEAGGVLLTAAGGAPTEASRTLVAGPPELCRQFIEAMAAFDLEGWSGDDATRPTA